MTEPFVETGSLADLTESNQPVKSRAGSPKQVWEIMKALEDENTERDRRMTKVQGNIDRNAPVSRARMVEAGRGDDANINWGEGKGQMDNAWTPYYDLTTEVPVCVDGDLDTGDASLDAELMRAFAEAFHKMVFGWDGFDLMTQLCDWQMLAHGHGWLVRCDPNDWRWETVLASNFYVPQRMRIDLEGGAHVAFKTEIEAGELWRKIGRPGWNKTAIWDAIQKSGKGDSQNWSLMQWQAALKAGDIYVSQKTSKTIMLANVFAKEMDGSISYHIVPRDQANSPKDFLYSKIGLYKDWNECICLFPYDIGSDGTVHSVRGLGTAIHGYCDLSNRIKNSLADLMLTGIKPMFQSETNSAEQDWQLARMGGYNIVPKGLNPLQMNIGPGLTSGIAGIQHFESTLTKNTGTFHEEVDAPRVEETAKAAMIRAAGRAKLTKGAHNRYYRSKDREYREMWRIAVNPKIREEMPGGKLALAFQKECRKIVERLRGPKDALQRVTNIRAVRTIGLGSAAMRIEIANAIMDKYPLLDPVGQNNALRMYFAALTSYHSVDGLVPSISTGQLAVEDDSQAADENNAFNILGPEAEVVITPRQQHDIHLNHHVASMERDMQACQQGQQEPRQCFGRLEAKGAHSHNHLNRMAGNPAKADIVKQFNERLRQLAAYQDHLQQNIEAEDAANPQPPPGQPDPDVLKVQGNLQLKAQAQEEKHALKAQDQEFNHMLKAREQMMNTRLSVHQAGVQTALSDAETAAAIHRENAKARNGAENGEK